MVKNTIIGQQRHLAKNVIFGAIKQPNLSFLFNFLALGSQHPPIFQFPYTAPNDVLPMPLQSDVSNTFISAQITVKLLIFEMSSIICR